MSARASSPAAGAHSGELSNSRMNSRVKWNTGILVPSTKTCQHFLYYALLLIHNELLRIGNCRKKNGSG
uniref:Uncharacterized protein n=1 Tax=Arundo donax TaxID=35708 RepID=A0A0A8YVL5_ARUDO